MFDANIVGRNVVMISIAQLLTTTAQLGLGYSLVRYLPEAGAEVKNIINFSLSFVVLCSLLVSVLIILIGPKISPSMQFIGREGIILFILFVMSLAIFQLIYQILASFRLGFILLTSNLVVGILRILFILFLRIPNMLYMPLATYVLPIDLVLVLLIFYIFPKSLHGYMPGFDFRFKKFLYLLKYSTPSYMGNILHDMPFQLLPQVVANATGFASSAYFYIAWQFYGLLTTLGGSVSQSLFVEGSHNEANVMELKSKSLFLSFVTTAILVMITVLFGYPILKLFGYNYAENGVAFLRIVSVAALPATIVYILNAFYRVKMMLYPIIIGYAIVACISLVLPMIIPISSLPQLGWLWLSSQIVAAVLLSLIVRVKG